MLPLRRGPWLSVGFAVLFVIAACKGDTGEQGPEGPQGPPGEPGQPPDGSIDPAPLGLVGRVMEPNRVPVPNGTVYLVPADDVAALSQQEIDLFATPQETAALTVDEPIEDLLDENAASYTQAPVEEGVYRFETLPTGSYFVVWTPADGDSVHLPGGDSSRVSFDTASLVGMQMDIRVSAQPSPAATYVGSTTCMGCHGLHSTTRTAHNVGLQVPGARSLLQDVEPWPDFDKGLEAFKDGTSLVYFNCSAMPSTHEDPSNCDVSASDPGTFDFRIDLRQETDGPIERYYVDMVNGTTEIYEVVLTYGGAVEKQQYLMRREMSGRFTYFVLPLQYNYQGDDSNPDPSDWQWRDYRSDLWYDVGMDEFRQPENKESFDNNCAGCHFTGYRLEGSDGEGWSARAIVDPAGAFDYDGDGKPELINTGCEACHGPGSEHLERSPRASYIVSPGLLTPGRHAAICGSCHSRPLGIGNGMTESTGLPLSAENLMPPPGIRRAEFAVNHTTRVSGAEEAFWDSDDSKANYQQYSDHLRSRHYRNPGRLVTCTGCHSPHANDADIADMDTSGNPNALCTTCHADILPVPEHVAAVTGVAGHASLEPLFGPYLCTECHMVPTAKSGAAVPALLDDLGGPPVQYYWNDIANHRMTVTRWEGGQPIQPIAFTNECGECHRESLPNTMP